METRFLEGTVNAAFDNVNQTKGVKKPPLRMVIVLVFIMCLFFILTLFENITATLFNVINNSEILKVLAMLRNSSQFS